MRIGLVAELVKSGCHRVKSKPKWTTNSWCNRRSSQQCYSSCDSRGDVHKIAAWHYGSEAFSARVELAVIDDFSNPNPSQKFADFVVNSANEALVGTQASYFPRGGRRQETVNSAPWEASSRWCGMEIGSDMVYPYQSCDGLIHRACGHELLQYVQKHIPLLPNSSALGKDELRCHPGDVVWTPSFDQLQQVYPHGIFHAVAPYYLEDNEEWRRLMRDCYTKVFHMTLCRHNGEGPRLRQGNVPAIQQCNQRIIPEVTTPVLAVPFLGTGVRSAPLMLGVSVALDALETFFVDCDSLDARQGVDSSQSMKLPTITIRYVTHHKDSDILDDMVNKFGTRRNMLAVRTLS